ncbi:hypothetical protein IFJ82_09595 [Novacetimonas hansenii]|uniref:hypothetical protein n=1 Tax=Novacetimonas hansenii TaxID=436 RepID=UPI0017840C8D|nr:hypothetical protein [Novacetimonas hansenii]QOF94205.1 hypothetical protein IFJ82_09595 [Novacetimonas hansenii]
MPDMSLPEFAGLLASMAGEIEHAAHEGLDQAAKIVEHEAKTELGHYQQGAGPFAPWAELADSTKDDRVRQGYPENEPGLRSGAMRGGIQHVVQGRTAYVGSDDDKLVYFELGTVKQPPRAVLAGSLIRKTDAVVHAVGHHFVGRLFGEEVVGGSMPIAGAED